MPMSKKQREFYDKNLKKILNSRKSNNHIFADKLERINKLLYDDKIPEALAQAENLSFSVGFIHKIKMIFAGFDS